MRKFSSKLAGQQSGFTLIELVIVIVIIGILAAVAIPQFSDLTDDAKKSSVEAKAASLASAQSANTVICKGLSGGASTCLGTPGTGYTTCDAAYTGLLGLDPTITVTGTTNSCTITSKTGTPPAAKTVKVMGVTG